MQWAPNAISCLVRDGLVGSVIVYDRSFDRQGAAFVLGGDHQALPVNADRISVEGLVMTDEELEEGVRRLLIAAADTKPTIRPEQAMYYFMEQDLVFGPQQGAILDVGDGQVLLVAEPEFIGAVAHLVDENTGEVTRNACLWNSRGVLRLDENAALWTPTPVPPIPVLGYQELADVDTENIRARWARMQKKRQLKPKGPDKRARDLLYRYLTREQKWEFRAHNRFTVSGEDEKTYRVYGYSSGNVKLVEDGKETRSFCVVANYTRNPLPLFDLLLAHKLFLESSIRSFMQIARSHAIGEERHWVQLTFPDFNLRMTFDPFVRQMEEALEWARVAGEQLRQRNLLGMREGNNENWRLRPPDLTVWREARRLFNPQLAFDFPEVPTVASAADAYAA